MHWEILGKEARSINDIVDVLLINRGLKTKKDKEEFFEPTDPYTIPLIDLDVKKTEIKKATDRIKQAQDNKEQVIIYGDYDADGITATAILWEALHGLGLDVLPHIPDRFEEGYGINPESIKNLKLKKTASYDGKNLKLIITVDNGIVGYDGIKAASKLGIDVIVIDHHTLGSKKNTALAVVHSTQTSGSGLAWFFAKELTANLKALSSYLELATIGTIADQLPLTGVNRSLVKYGLRQLNKTKRPGLLALFKESGIEKDNGQTLSIGTYEVGYIIAPRVNAMGRLKHGIESLRLLCTKDATKAFEIAKNIGGTNLERQKIVEQVVILARKNVTSEKVIVIFGENYHEGVIGLAAGRLVEEFYRPAIVFSVKGDISKASARSIYGFNIIDAIRSVNLHSEGGGHPMAAGFSIPTSKIVDFTKSINKYAAKLLTDELLQKRLKIDCEIAFDQIDYNLYNKLSEFDPTGIGNSTPTFVTKKIEVLSVKPVGRESKHLKLKLRQDGISLDAIWFNATSPQSLVLGATVDVVYNIDDNSWNGYKNLQLKVKDIQLV